MTKMSELVGKDELKTQFITREGTYKLMTLGEYSRPNRVGYNAQAAQAAQANTPVRVSFVSCPEPAGDRICFNVGRELYVYLYKGVKKAADLSKPVDKRVYKGTYPTSHDFNQSTVSSDSVALLVGFSAGQIQLIDPSKKEMSRLYNEERLIDKTKVTCLKWLPNSPNLFLVSHASGQMYVYKEDLPCGTAPPHYQLFKQGEAFAVYTCKTKSTRNPLYRWVVGEGSLNEFAFSPCSKYLATASQDGFLRIFNYDTMDLIGLVRSYFGGLLCVCWSPDSKYVVTGGEDDLVTVWSFGDKRVVARGHGHKSWVSVVQFDAFTTSYGELDLLDFSGSEEELASTENEKESGENSKKIDDNNKNNSAATTRSNRNSTESSRQLNITSYRFGSVGQDTQLCLWDLTEDVLKQPLGRTRTSILLSSPSQLASLANSQLPTQLKDPSAKPPPSSQDKKNEHKRNFSLASRNSDKNSVNSKGGGNGGGGGGVGGNRLLDDPVRLIGTPLCPRLDDVPMLEPLVCKKIAHERLTALVFKQDCIVTACQEGFVCTWARPGKTGVLQQMSSPNLGNGGTVV